ncbi:stigma-specific STIG1-like protein 1 [Benincasa hispida]|uniref:stigma-specific STIG1-like protein 1 n=1 Tax=Benincasa hispida TaxID=102211 RepID=UPI0018FFDAE9|nr:stigma-specific STIG1-like protein 1 [Benincasa hispida]
MKFSKLFLLVALITISHYAAQAAEVEMSNKENATSSDDEVFDQLPHAATGNYPSGSLRGLLFNFESLQKGVTCNKYPRVCRAKGSKGPDCCNKKCVNVETDRNNCGMCGNKCKYSRICCNGRCVNPMFNKKHCGGCNNECSKGSLCAYGMCDYA